MILLQKMFEREYSNFRLMLFEEVEMEFKWKYTSRMILIMAIRWHVNQWKFVNGVIFIKH